MHLTQKWLITNVQMHKSLQKSTNSLPNYAEWKLNRNCFNVHVNFTKLIIQVYLHISYHAVSVLGTETYKKKHEK